MKKWQAFQQIVPGKLDIHVEKKERLDTDPTPFAKINPKWTTDLM